MRLIQLCLAAMLATVLTLGIAHAQTVLERLVSPGPLAARHANLESRCAACHDVLEPGKQTRLCAECHRPIGADRRAHTGFHGRDRRASNEACRVCHTDHEGRSANIVGFDPRRFNHATTDYPLRGAHAGVACASCHQAGRKYRDAPGACVDCHRTDEPHRGRLGTRCTSCHNEESWRSVRYDHSRTQFPLVGAHLRARCVLCHANERYDGTPTQCVECHRDDDAHQGSLGPACGDCHTANGWKTGARFDHSATGFPLRGRHASIECRACHVQPAGQVRLPTTCVACHRDEDARAHQGRNGPSCQNCHNESDWRRTSFDHARATRFPLRGAHAGLACARCHVRPAREVRLDMACASCHRDDDAHGGQLGTRCEQCHNDRAWTASVRFDHGLTQFPLLGKHANAQCASCHQTRRFRDAPTECVACHADDDRHEGRLGRDCAACHVPVGWANWTFDHDTQTDFRLTGAHDGLQCEACHTERGRDRVRQSTACIACHRPDDVHRGEFGSECGRCHTTETFRGARSRL